MSKIVEALDRLCEANNSLSKDKELLDFMNMSSNIDFTDQLRITKAAVDKFFEELKYIKSKEDSWDYLDTIYTMKRDFYKKYIDFARKCREMSNMTGISGYGKNDFIKIKLVELCRSVDYKFPYGWKPYNYK